MSRHTNFSSSDFALVPAHLSPGVADNLVHIDVLGTHEACDTEFSRQRHHLVRPVKLPSRIVSVTIGGLNPGEATRKHRHNYETIIYFLSGTGKSFVEDQEVNWTAGDAIYIPVWAWHQHVSSSDTGPVQYVACENAPMLQNLGIALREEEQEAADGPP
jgi:quercetin dioxygenase-like cupin family protein